MNKKRSGITILEVLIAMAVFSIAISIVFIIPRTIVNYAKEVDVKMDLYEVALNRAEEIIALPAEDDPIIESHFLNGATFTIRVDWIEDNVTIEKVTIPDPLNENPVESNTDSIKVASITVTDSTRDFSVAFKIVPRQ